MNSNDKQYTSGTVNISTEEYRDLITELAEAKAESSQNNNQRWERERERDAARKELEELKIKYAKLYDFVNSSEEMKAKYKLYIIENTQTDDE